MAEEDCRAQLAAAVALMREELRDSLCIMVDAKLIGRKGGITSADQVQNCGKTLEDSCWWCRVRAFVADPAQFTWGLGMTRPSVQGVRPSPREMTNRFARSIGMQNDVNFKDLLEAAITRDREQGRAAEAAEIARLREALDRACHLAENASVLVHEAECQGRYEACYDEDVGCGEVRETIHNLRALAAPLAPATAGKGTPR